MVVSTQRVFVLRSHKPKWGVCGRDWCVKGSRTGLVTPENATGTQSPSLVACLSMEAVKPHFWLFLPGSLEPWVLPSTVMLAWIIVLSHLDLQCNGSWTLKEKSQLHLCLVACPSFRPGLSRTVIPARARAARIEPMCVACRRLKYLVPNRLLTHPGLLHPLGQA